MQLFGAVQVANTEHGAHTRRLSSEERLWWAVIATLMHDAKVLLSRMSRQKQKTGRVCHAFDAQWKTLNYEASSPHMRDVCDFVGWDQDRLLAYLDRLQVTYGCETYEVEPFVTARGSVL